MWGVFFYSLRRGAWAERLAASTILVGTYLTLLVLSPLAIRYQHVEFSVLVDLAVVLIFLYISLLSASFWPLWLTAMQSLTVLSHLAPYVPHILPWSYWRAVAVWSWPMLIVLAFAIRRHHQEQPAVARSTT